jgi:hypothetical protein
MLQNLGECRELSQELLQLMKDLGEIKSNPEQMTKTTTQLTNIQEGIVTTIENMLMTTQWEQLVNETIQTSESEQDPGSVQRLLELIPNGAPHYKRLQKSAKRPKFDSMQQQEVNLEQDHVNHVVSSLSTSFIFSIFHSFSCIALLHCHQDEHRSLTPKGCLHTLFPDFSGHFKTLFPIILGFLTKLKRLSTIPPVGDGCAE